MMRAAAGYSLIEVTVAILLFGIVAAAVGQTVVITQRARQVSENWLQATQLAGERLEAVRAGALSDDTPTVGIFQRQTTVSAVAGHPGLRRVDVTISWADSAPKAFTLSSLVRQ